MPVDPRLAQLRKDVEMSIKQAADTPADRRPGHRLGPDQQPGVPVQSLIEVGVSRMLCAEASLTNRTVTW